MKSLLKSLVVTAIAAAAVLAGSGVAGAAPSLPALPSVPSVPSLPSAPPLSCVAPVVEAPAATITGALRNPAGAVRKNLACVTGRG